MALVLSEVPPYVGIMFEMHAKSDVEVQTFELDVRLDLLHSAGHDLSIEVFTVDGSYDAVMDQPDSWDRLAGTYLVPSPDGGGAIIPASDFSPVRIAAGGKRSFYVTMKYPYLDHTVYGLQHTGDIHISGDDIQLLVGSGFTSYKFPGVADTTLDPQFAGVVHYTKTFACDDVKASQTLADYMFLFEVSNVDDALMSNANAAIDRAVSELLASNGMLKTFVKEQGLQKDPLTATTLESYSCKYGASRSLVIYALLTRDRLPTYSSVPTRLGRMSQYLPQHANLFPP
jgi:hypothetical protein